MSNPGDAALVNRLRMDLELKTEVIKALRAERDHDGETARDQAALMAAVSGDLHAQATALGLLIAERDTAAVQRVAENLATVSADLADYTAARTGELALTREPVNLRQLMSRLESRSAVELHIASDVPERVTADQARLSRVLSQFVSAGLEEAGSGVLVLEVSLCVLSDADAGEVQQVQQVQFALLHHGADRRRLPRSAASYASPIKRLRAALAHALCELMGAVQAPMRLTLPLQSAVDQAHTGMFRISPSGAASAKSLPEIVLAHDEDTSIDLLYLDRQLGSLAKVILARTAPAFMAQAQRRMTDLHVANDILDLERLQVVARTWKGSALSVGARGLAALLDAVEKQATAGRVPGPGPVWQVRSALDRVVRALKSYGEASGDRHVRA